MVDNDKTADELTELFGEGTGKEILFNANEKYTLYIDSQNPDFLFNRRPNKVVYRMEKSRMSDDLKAKIYSSECQYKSGGKPKRKTKKSKKQQKKGRKTRAKSYKKK